jgi:peptide deformylase
MPERAEQHVDAAQGAPIVLLGDPRLRIRSQVVDDIQAPAFLNEKIRLQATLAAFRAAYGFGRAVSAPQIGVGKRFIALNLEGDAFVMINPEITWKHPDTFTMWDDCMSFPFLLVRVCRHQSISVRYTDEEGRTRHREHMDQATSELLQHEIDHLDGMLAVDRAVDRDSLVSREVFESEPQWFEHQVDYVIRSQRS